MKLLRVRQQLVSRPHPDVASAVLGELDRLQLDVPPGDVAITVGSRGIANLPLIVQAIGAWLRQRGAMPFIVPAMGSHNGATADGQLQMVKSLGVSERTIGMPMRSSMECVKVGETALGSVWMDRYCLESAGVLVVNRIKLHTGFSGPIQSGLTKMMVVGLGKVEAARAFHSAPQEFKSNLLAQMGQTLLASGKILAGLGILEDGCEQTAEIHALRPEQFLDEEPRLLERHQAYFPRLPIDDLNVLIVDSIGKTYSGTGMDTNVIGRRGMMGFEDLTRPRIRIIGVLELAAASQGNAIGVGLADFITQRVRNAIDERKTFINALTTGEMARIRIPATLADDEELVTTVRDRFGDQRWMIIPNTLQLQRLYISEDLEPEIRQHPQCEVLTPTVSLVFRDGRHRLDFTWPD